MRRLTGKILTLLIATGLAVAGYGVLSHRPRRPPPTVAPAAHESPSAFSQAAHATPSGALSADDWMKRILETLERRLTISCRVLQRVRLDDEELDGVGFYLQKGIGKQRRTRWEVQSQDADGVASYVQVLKDGRYLWTDRSRDGRRTVSRIDLNWLRTLLYSQTPEEQAGMRVAPELALIMARGGLSQLIAELSDQMHFQLAVADSSTTAEYLTIVGSWKPDALARLWPEARDGQATHWPSQLPWQVTLQVGRNDFFPHVIEYYKGKVEAATGQGGGVIADGTLARFEFFEVDFARAVDDRHFNYAAGETQWADETTAAIRRLRKSDPEQVAVTERFMQRVAPR